MATSPQEKAYCVLEYAKTSSVVVVQRHFRTKFFKEPPHRHNIIRWMKQFEETGCLCKGKSRGRPPVENEVVENIRETFVRSPTKSTRRASAELNVSQSTVWRVLRKRLQFKPLQQSQVKMSSEHYVVLHTGQKMPLVGLGTWKSEAGQVKEAVKYALGIGYRHIDCATAYSNEGEIGDCLQEIVGADKPVKREELFVTSKLWNTKHHPEDVEPALKKTLQDLKLDYLDLYLMHWPHAFERGDNLFPKNLDGTMRYDYTDYKETWKAMEKLVTKGLVKAIGLSNFNSRQIDDIIGIASVKPAVLQVECHPYLAQNELIAHCQKQGLVVTAYSPLGSPDRMWKHPDEPVLLEEPGIKKLAEKYNKSPAQILLRWQVQRDVVVIPKSVTPARLLQNLQVFDFSLSSDEMTYIGNLNKNWRYIVPMITIEGKLVARDAGHPFYPFNEPH